VRCHARGGAPRGRAGTVVAAIWHGKQDNGLYTVHALAKIGIAATIICAFDPEQLAFSDQAQVDPNCNFIRSGNLTHETADAVWFPDGGAHAYGNVVGDQGIANIQKFVSSGGAYIGVLRLHLHFGAGAAHTRAAVRRAA